MRQKFKAAVKDPLFLRLCLLAVAMLALAFIVILSYGKPALYQLVIVVYVIYAIILFYFIKTLIKLYLKYFREKSQLKESRFKKRLKAIWRKFDEKVRQIFNLKPRGLYFGGEDTEYDAEDISGTRAGRRENTAKIKWNSLHENREKVRFLYAARVGAGISDGEYIAVSDTARQVGEKLTKNERDGLLFELYESVRYTDHERKIDDGQIAYLCEKDTTAKRKKKI